METYDLANASGVSLDNTIHNYITDNTVIDVNTPNMSKYRYIKVVSGCGDVKVLSIYDLKTSQP